MTKSLLLVSAARSVAYPAFSDDVPTHDKPNSTLFNPTPTDQMRSFATDRPTKLDLLYAVGAELDIFENAALNSCHTNYSGLINISHSDFDNSVGGTLEFWSDVNCNQDAATQNTIDFTLSWRVKDNPQLDAGIKLGLNEAANDLQPYLGISQRF